MLAATLDADWFVHLDADEIRLPPRSVVTLAEAIAEVDALGYNAVNFQEYTFVPTKEAPDHDHPRFQETMRHYYAYSPGRPDRLNAWKRQDARVELAANGGHQVSFPGLNPHPHTFPMKHYLYLSAAHAVSKYVERVYDPNEVDVGLAPAASGTPRRGRHAPSASGAPGDALRRRPRCLRRPERASALRPFMSKGLLLVGATIASFPGNGGICWERLSWVLGFKRIGYDVMWVDQLGRGHCAHPLGSTAEGYDGCLNIPWFESVVERFGLTGSVSLIGDAGESLSGRSFEHALEMAGDADLLVNPGGDLRHAAFKRRARRAVYIDVDPGFTQLWLASGRSVPRVDGHDLHFTIGENVGTPASDLPTAGIEWRHTRQPVVLEEWPFVDAVAEPRFTTVGRWRGVGPHGSLDDIGEPFPQKGDELERVLDLPERTGLAFEIALDTRGDDVPRRLLERHGWSVVEPASVAADPDSFRRYVQGSWAEFSVAKGAYVETSTGWFSERTARYLASGRPALVQDTGFSRTLPVGEGLLAFRTLEEAVGGAQRIAADYESHRRAARAIAEEYFDSDKLLTRLLEDAI